MLGQDPKYTYKDIYIYTPASSKGCCLNPKGWCFLAPLIIHSAPLGRLCIPYTCFFHCLSTPSFFRLLGVVEGPFLRRHGRHLSITLATQFTTTAVRDRAQFCWKGRKIWHLPGSPKIMAIQPTPPRITYPPQ